MYTKNNVTRFSSIITRRLLLGICCCLSIFLFACSSQSSKNDSNLFQYAVKSSDSTLSPKNVTFGMTMEEVQKAAKTSESNIDTTLGEDQPRIIKSISISGLSDDIQEIYSFQDDKLVSVEYTIKVSESEFEKALQTLNTQAAALPADWLMGENHILDGKTTSWEDTQKNTVTLSFPETNTSGERVILLGLYMAKGSFTELPH